MTKRLSKLFIILAVVFLLTPAEVSISSPLIITHSSSMPPISFINDEGEPDGLLIDFWNEWSRQSGIDIKFKLLPWKNSVQQTIDGDADINAGMYYSSSRAREMIFGDYIFHIQGGLFAAKDMVGSKILNRKESCGVIKGGYSKIFMQEKYPFTPLIIYNSAWDMYHAAAEGRLKLFVADFPVAAYQLHTLGITDRFQCLQKLYTRDIYPTVSKRNPKLIKRINLYIAAIPRKRKKAILQKWLDLKGKDDNHRRTAGIVTGLVLLVMGYLHRTQIMVALKALKGKIFTQA
ncbi:transporter substrate-binding domain-containing protein [Desulfovibrio sp. JC010]|uniref:transporter substrate-binding domain-containing protein n=1 Tax=Desulfovibrio sp. JC010 TaxID=2593641 RepID=UPI0013D0D578|nr:transporter substrate-binding domain-containing protein [Desulfovibrio sp. JC010]NDV28247.1 transporter substrate-binding domain-containing protein [Desulfovibrio sp. JC010]